VLKLDLPSVLFQNKNSYLDSYFLFVFEGQNTSETVPDELVVDSVSMNAFLKLSVVLKEYILSHSSFVGAELIVFLSVGEGDGYAGVHD
jgi:hypothetical protein